MFAFQFILFSIAIFFQVYQVHLLNILGIFPFQGKSHFISHHTLLKDLTRRGHNVTVISYFPQKIPLENYHEINLKWEENSYENFIAIENPSYFKLMYRSLYLALLGNRNCKALLSDENVQNLWIRKENFDVIVTEQFISDCALGIAHELDAPVVGVTSHSLMPFHYNRFGVPQHPAFTPFQLLNGGIKTNLIQRIERTIFTAYYQYIVRILSQRMDEYILSHYFKNLPPLEELAKDIKFLLLYEHFVLFSPYTLPTNVIQVGGFHVADVKPLPIELQKFIDESKYGVIYISFGTMLRSSSIAQEKLDAIVGAIQKLRQRVIWKWDSNSLPIKAKNVYISKWLPQNDILGHPKVLAMFSHGGLLSIIEATHHGVPVIGMPVFGDQPRNAAAIEEVGLGVQIQVDELTKESLLKKFEIVLSIQFRNKVKWMSKMWKDRPISSMDTAVYWLEYAARYNNVTFRTAAADVPLYQIYNLDELFIMITVFTIVFFAIKYVVKFCLSKNKNWMHKDCKMKKP